jgi:hypothetical protein
MRKSKNENENKNENERKRKRKRKMKTKIKKKDETYLSSRIANRISRSIRSKEDEPKNEKTKELGAVSQNENEKEKKKKKKYLSSCIANKIPILK